MLKRTTTERSGADTALRGQNTFKIRFAINAPGAKRVCICGDFNQWNTSSAPLRESAPGQWETVLSLLSGRYQYKFIVDGQWAHDPTARQNVTNQYGSLNSVINVGAAGAGL